MKKIWHSMLCGGALAALLCTPALAAGEGDFSLVVNGEPVSFTDALPQLRENRSFLPMAATSRPWAMRMGPLPGTTTPAR